MDRKTREFQFVPSRGVVLAILLFLFILLLTFVFGDRGIVEIARMKKEIRRLDQSITGLEEEKQRLQEDVTELKQNPSYIEQKAREKLWLMKKNEKVVVLIRDKK